METHFKKLITNLLKWLFIVLFNLGVNSLYSQTGFANVYIVRDTIICYDSKYSNNQSWRTDLMINEYWLSKTDYDIISKDTTLLKSITDSIKQKYYPFSLYFITDSQGRWKNPFTFFKITIENVDYNFIFPYANYKLEKEKLKSSSIKLVENFENAFDEYYGTDIEILLFDSDTLLHIINFVNYSTPENLFEGKVLEEIDRIKVRVRNKYDDIQIMTFNLF